MKKYTITITTIAPNECVGMKTDEMLSDAYTDATWSMMMTHTEKVEDITNEEAKVLLREHTGLDEEEYPYGLAS